MSEELTVELCSGGHHYVDTEDEVDHWETLKERYQSDYNLTKISDLTLLDNLLQAHLAQYRLQRELSGRMPEYDDEDLPTGKLIRVKPDNEMQLRKAVREAGADIRAIHKELGIDKRSRELSGDMTTAGYLEKLKEFGAEYGIHVAERTLLFEEFVNELAWRVRLEQNGDDEDRQYHNCTPEGILGWIREEIEKIVEKDKEFAKQRGKLVVGSF